MSKRKKLSPKQWLAVVAMIAVLVASLAGGTFAWSAMRESALNEAKDTGINPGGRLHDDFDGINKDIYVENFGTLPIYARIQLSEYMEIGDGAGLKGAWNATGAQANGTQLGVFAVDTNNNATPFKTGALIGDVSTWSVHKPGAVGGKADDCELESTGKFLHDYWIWTMGGQKVYMPTFNKNKDSLKTDYTGLDAWGINAGDYQSMVGDPVNGANSDTVGSFLFSGLPGGHNQWAAGEQETKTAYYKNKTPTETHEAQPTLSGGVITMKQWIDDYACAPGAYWVLDNDGWAYWAQAIEPGTATGLLLSEITLKQEMEDDWYYAIFANAELVSMSDLDMIRDKASSDAKDLIDIAWSSKITVSPSNGSVSSVAPLQMSASVSNAASANVTWSISPAVSGASVDATGLVTVDGSVPPGTRLYVKATSVADPTKSSTAEIVVTATVNAFYVDYPSFMRNTSTYPNAYNWLNVDNIAVNSAFTYQDISSTPPFGMTMNKRLFRADMTAVAGVTGISDKGIWTLNAGTSGLAQSALVGCDQFGTVNSDNPYTTGAKHVVLDMTGAVPGSTITITAKAFNDYSKTKTFTIEIDTAKAIPTIVDAAVKGAVTVAEDDNAKWWPIAEYNGYYLVVRDTALDLPVQSTTFGPNFNYNDPANNVRREIADWYTGISGGLLKTEAVASDALDRLGSTMAQNGDGYSRPTSTTPGTGAPFALSSGEAISFLSRYHHFTTPPFQTGNTNGNLDKGTSAGSGKNWLQLSDRGTAYSWLRSPGENSSAASGLSTSGNATAGNATAGICSVRPALWVTADFFD